jgi:hypothetical protein
MKYLNKYNEGIFSSKKVDKKLINDIKKYLEDNYQVINYNEDNDEFVFRFNFEMDDLIERFRGEIKISDEYQQETGIKKITKAFSKPAVKFTLCRCDDRGNNSGRSLASSKMFDPSGFYESITDTISNVISFIKKHKEQENKVKKEKEELKDKTISKDELGDVIVNLCDICDSYTIKDIFQKRRDGYYFYLLSFVKNDIGINIKEIEELISSKSYGTPRVKIDNIVFLKSLVGELDDIKYSLKEGWDLEVNIYLKKNAIEIEIYEASKKI